MTLCLLCLTSSALAAEPEAACSGPSIRLDVDVGAAWLEALRLAKQRLADERQLDLCAEVTVTPAQGGVLVTARLADGRRTARLVTQPDALSSVLESLLLVPISGAAGAKQEPDVPPVPATAASAPPTSSRSLDGGNSATADTDTQILPKAPRPLAPEFEIGIGPTVALSLSPSYLGYGVGAHGLVAMNGWLFESRFRWHIEDRGTGQALPSGFNMQQFALGVGFGHRWSPGGALLDAVAYADAVVINQEAYGADPEGVGGAHGDMSLGVALRVATPARRQTRFYGSLGLDLFPQRIGRDERVDETLPSLPALSLGATLGASWSIW